MMMVSVGVSNMAQDDFARKPPHVYPYVIDIPPPIPRSAWRSSNRHTPKRKLDGTFIGARCCFCRLRGHYVRHCNIQCAFAHAGLGRARGFVWLLLQVFCSLCVFAPSGSWCLSFHPLWCCVAQSSCRRELSRRPCLQAARGATRIVALPQRNMGHMLIEVLL
jgi:hypothetical protein